jgi:four helix bundle protein
MSVQPSSCKRIVSYRDLDVWRLAMRLVVSVYSHTRQFPGTERYGLSSQMQRAAVSVAANIAEGHGRAHRGEYARFLSMANGSLKELETEFLLAKQLGYLTSDSARHLLLTTDRMGRMLGSLIRKLRQPPRPSPIPNP